MDIMAEKQLVFIDDSGDPGFKSVSSSHFVMAAAVFVDPKVAALLSEEMINFRCSLGWSDTCEFKFAKDRKIVVKNVLRLVSQYDFQVYATYIKKANFHDIAQIIDNKKLYNWTIKELLEIIPLSNAKIRIDGRSSRANMRESATYLRRQLNPDNSKKLEIKFEDSVDNNLIQLADLVAGSINRYLNNDKTDAKVYYNLIRKKIRILKQLTS